MLKISLGVYKAYMSKLLKTFTVCQPETEQHFAGKTRERTCKNLCDFQGKNANCYSQSRPDMVYFKLDFHNN
jgi:hypothetical protein